jgi:deoxyribonuclease IV
MLLGVHVSISGGYDNAFTEAEKLGIDTFQIFTKNQRQWREKKISKKEAETFRKNMEQFGIKVAFAHTTYLINIASSDDKIREQSVISLLAEVQRCHELGLAFCVLHPGSFKNTTFEQGMQNVIDGLLSVLENSKDSQVKILLENTAGQGSSLGGKFEHIAEMIKAVGSERIGLCFDTCHAFAAGYDIRTEDGFNLAMERVEETIGLKNLHAFHMNDSKGDLGTHLDRHENIGKGKLGIEPFRQIINKFPHIPKVLETPKEGDMDAINLDVLRGLRVE